MFLFQMEVKILLKINIRVRRHTQAKLNEFPLGVVMLLAAEIATVASGEAHHGMDGERIKSFLRLH